MQIQEFKIQYFKPNSLKFKIINVYFCASYKFNNDISIGAGYSQMFASEGLEVIKNNTDGNANNWAWLMVTIKPTLFSTK